MVGTLSPDDVTGLQLELSTDADWNGDAFMTRSVSGMYLELVIPMSGNVFSLAWRSSGQSVTSCSTAESEVVALSHGLRHIGLPVQDLVQEFSGERMPLVCLSRTHRIAIGSLHEIIGDEKQRVEIRYIESKLQKGNIYTKAMVPAQFSAERLLIGMQRPSNYIEVDDLTVLRTPRRSGKFDEIPLSFVRLSLNSLASSQFGRIDFSDMFVHSPVESPME